MKVKGPGRDFGLDFGHRIGRGRVSEAVRSASVASVFADRRSMGAIRPVFGRAWSAQAAVGVVASGGERLGCGWARVDEVSKRRRQGLVVCRATLPFEGLGARPGVTLAPTFLGPAGLVVCGLAACQSETIRV
jgi:hypothetical protein